MEDLDGRLKALQLGRRRRTIGGRPVARAVNNAIHAV
jgi:hypothetical protein